MHRKSGESDKVRVLRPSPYAASTDPSSAVGSLTSVPEKPCAPSACRGQFPDQMATAGRSLQLSLEQPCELCPTSSEALSERSFRPCFPCPGLPSGYHRQVSQLLWIRDGKDEGSTVNIITQRVLLHGGDDTGSRGSDDVIARQR